MGRPEARFSLQLFGVLAFAALQVGAQLWTTCQHVIAIPGNPYNVDDTACAPCANGAQSWYPCDDPSLCYCYGTTIPPQYLLPFSNCSAVVAVPAQFSTTDAQCAVCNYGVYRWWPCEAQDVGVLCQCSTFAPPATAAPTDASTPIPPTAAPTDASTPNPPTAAPSDARTPIPPTSAPSDASTPSPPTAAPATSAPTTSTTAPPPASTATPAPTATAAVPPTHAATSSPTAAPPPINASTTDVPSTTDLLTATPATDTLIPQTAAPQTDAPTSVTEPPSQTEVPSTTTTVAQSTEVPHVSLTPAPGSTSTTEVVTSTPSVTAEPVATPTLGPSPAPTSLSPPVAPTTEPAVPPGVVAAATVAGSLAFAQSVDDLRRRQSELRDAIADAALVQPEAVTIVSILPGSTIVRFEIATRRSSADIGASLVAALGSSSRENATAGSALKAFTPILDTLALKQSSGKALFAIGVAFYAGIGLAGLAVAAALAWSAYRRRYPDVRSRAKAAAVVSGGTIHIHFGPEEDVEDDAQGESDIALGIQKGCEDSFLALGAAHTLAHSDINRIVPSSRTRDGRESDVDTAASAVDWLKCGEEYYDLEAVGVATPFSVDSPQQQQPALLSFVPMPKAGLVPRMPNRRHSPASRRSTVDGRESPVRVEVRATDVEPDGQVDARRGSERRVTFAMRMARLQPSREVIDGDLTASYAIV